jgi:hypothetical protein
VVLPVVVEVCVAIGYVKASNETPRRAFGWCYQRQNLGASRLRCGAGHWLRVVMLVLLVLLRTDPSQLAPGHAQRCAQPVCQRHV